ncbi:hypothetical protein KAR91_36635, partial [Candidatus Pacearchaeota archaeon]|nr:hypothetical protein [Candidatus Pacearchaeota archaeon]
MITTIQVDTKLKEKLDKLKSHHRETYNEVLERLVKNQNPNADVESLEATIEVMSDPETMRNIAEAVQEINKGN